MAYELKKVIPIKWVSKTRIFCRKKSHSFLDPYQEWTPKGAKMAPEKPRNDPHMLKTPKIFDFYHKTLRLKFVYHGSTIYLIRTFLSNLAHQMSLLRLYKVATFKSHLKKKCWLKILIDGSFWPLTNVETLGNSHIAGTFF